MIRRLQRKVLRLFAWADRPAAWVLMLGGFVTFLAVVFNLIATGSAKWATLLIAADLTVSGFSAVQEAENEDDSEEGERVAGNVWRGHSLPRTPDGQVARLASDDRGPTFEGNAP